MEEFLKNYQEKRKFVRVEPEEKITIQIIYGNRVISGIIRDISVGGVGVYTNEGELPKPGERVKLKFELEGNFFEIDGKVRYVIKEGNFYRMGIQFVSLPPGEEEKIAGYVINIQFNILRKLR
jgi:c-di-GMP-binding flagellar brake protein YcgR